MPFAELSDARIHYEIVGRGEPVLLVAGLGGAASYWTPNIDAFTRNYSVILHDHRGTGRSTRSEMQYSIELMAEDLLRVMDAAGIEKAHLVGHSTGGAIGQVLGATASDRIASLVLYASWSVLDPQMEMCLDTRRKILRSMGEAEYHKASPIFLYPPYYVRDNKQLLRDETQLAINNSPPASILDARVTGIMRFEGLDYLGRIQCPTLVLVANDDILTPPYLSELMAEKVRGAKLIKLSRGGHAVSRTEPNLFNESVLEFIGQHSMERAPV